MPPAADPARSVDAGGDSRLVTKFYALQATRSTGFVSPVFALFVLRDVTFAEFGVLSAVLGVVVVGGEVPTGYVGDRYGRKTSLALSVAFTVVSLLGFVVAQGFVPYLLLYVLWAFALTFASGSVDAWLYELLEERLSADRYTTIRGRGASVMRLTSVVTMVGGGALYVVDPVYPFLAAAALSALGLVVLWSMPESRGGDTAGRGVERNRQVGPREALEVVRHDLTAPPLRWLALYAGLFFAVVSAATSYVQPVAEAAVRDGLDAASVELLGTALPLGLLLGLLYASFTAVSAVASYYAGDVEARVGLSRTLLLVPLATAGLLVAPRFVPLLAFPMFVALKGSWALLFPMVSGRLNDGLGSTGRATALSAFSMLYQLAKVPLVLAAGVVAGGMGPTAATALLGGVFLVGATVAWAVGGPVARPASETA
ncbi:MFS transporter [Halobium salinum]|uniref:MFS transporter n=1 Tax=Halobium salinum TaxID=1364940 RepID=A0ABD5PBV2_9EURY|nr:MFS transporter [Halobium salinum]